MPIHIGAAEDARKIYSGPDKEVCAVYDGVNNSPVFRRSGLYETAGFTIANGIVVSTPSHRATWSTQQSGVPRQPDFPNSWIQNPTAGAQYGVTLLHLTSFDPRQVTIQVDVTRPATPGDFSPLENRRLIDAIEQGIWSLSFGGSTVNFAGPALNVNAPSIAFEDTISYTLRVTSPVYEDGGFVRIQWRSGTSSYSNTNSVRLANTRTGVTYTPFTTPPTAQTFFRARQEASDGTTGGWSREFSISTGFSPPSSVSFAWNRPFTIEGGSRWPTVPGATASWVSASRGLSGFEVQMRIRRDGQSPEAWGSYGSSTRTASERSWSRSNTRSRVIWGQARVRSVAGTRTSSWRESSQVRTVS